MRTILVASALLTLTLHAAPSITFSTDHPHLSAGEDAYVYLNNTTDESAHDVVVRFELAEGLSLFREPSSAGQGWQCATEAQVSTCRIAEFEAQRFDLLHLMLEPTEHSGGHRNVTATLTAADVPAQTLVIDAVTARIIRVTTGSDFGAGSMRAAIEDINEQALCGTEVPCNIVFVPPSDVHPLTIAPATPLPAIRKCNVKVGGLGDVEFPPLVQDVEISGHNATYGNGLEIRASCAAGVPGVSIEGIAVHSWPWNGIYFEAPAAHAGDAMHSINRVYVGTDRTGRIARPNGSRGIVTDSPYETLAIYNSLAGGNVRSGIAFFRGKRAIVTGSLLGVDRDGHPLRNGGAGLFTVGVPLQAALNTIAYNGMGVAVAKGTRAAAITQNTIYANDGLAIDWGLDGRVPADAETIAAPRLLSAFYDASANVTYVRAVVYLRAGEHGNRFIITPYRSNERGDAIGAVPEFPTLLFGTVGGGEQTFEIGIPGDFRGAYLALQTHAADDHNQRLLSSEISESIVVP